VVYINIPPNFILANLPFGVNWAFT